MEGPINVIVTVVALLPPPPPVEPPVPPPPPLMFPAALHPATNAAHTPTTNKREQTNGISTSGQRNPVRKSSVVSNSTVIRRSIPSPLFAFFREHRLALQ
jgi:hypothetical protein